MRLFLDACVLYPVATREILFGYAKLGGFTPLWSARIIEEWARAAGTKMGAEDEARARGDAALMGAWFPGGEVTRYEAKEAECWSPDPADAHVIAAAVVGQAEAIITFNIRDFPLKSVRPHGLWRMHPDEMLSDAMKRDAARLSAALAGLADMAAGRDMPFRKFLKRAGLPRLGKAWEAAQEGPQ
ncbi:MAG: PIN domain-containing protein [Pseudomonadota bacterium]